MPTTKRMPDGITIKTISEPVIEDNVVHLDPRIMRKLKELAAAQGTDVDKMCNLIVWKTLNPDGRPMELEEIP